ncbi:MAG: tetratricopeptide repeat protein [Guyparkeria sp.]
MRLTPAFPVIFGLGLLSIGSGCALNPQDDQTFGNGVPDMEFMSVANQRAASTESSSEDSTVYRILAAEFYGRHKQYDLAADHYASVASEIRQPDLLERAIQVAIFADRFDLAQVLASHLESIDPDNPRAAAVLMISALELDQTDKADRALNKWLESDTGNARQIFNEVGQYLQRSLDRERAITYTRHLAERFPRQYDAQIMVAKLGMSFGEMSMAREAADRAVELGPDQTLSYDLAMVIANRQGDVDHALAILEQAHARFPEESRYLSGLIEARIAAGETSAAASLIDTALESGERDPETLRNLALLSYELERPDLATRALDRLTRIPGQSDMVHLIRGRVALQEGDQAAARQALSQVSVESEQYANAQVLLAGARVSAGDDEAAVEGLRSALRHDAIDESDQQQLTLALSSTLAEIGQFERSLQVANRAIDAWPDANDFRLQKAMSLFALDEQDLAIDVLRTIIEREPEHAAALNALGYTLADLDRDLDEAERLIGQALQIDPGNAAYMDSLGWLKYRQGKLDEAQAALENAYRQSPNAEIGAHLGEVLWEKDERDRAIEIWEESLELNPGDSTLLETLRRYAPELLPADNE